VRGLLGGKDLTGRLEMAIRTAVSLAARAPALAESKRTCTTPLALVVAGATVVIVPVQVGAIELAPGKPGIAPWVKAHPIPVAIRLRNGANVPAGAAVVRIGTQKGAGPVAIDSARGAVVNARSGNARDNLAGRRRGTHGAASSAVEFVIVEIGAIIAATGLPNEVAVVAAGPAVRVRRQVAAGVVSAGSTDVAGVAIARPTGREALRLLRLRATLTEGFARVGAVSPDRGSQPQRGQDRAGENGPQPAQRFAPRNWATEDWNTKDRLGQRFGEFIKKISHDRFLSWLKKTPG